MVYEREGVLEEGSDVRYYLDMNEVLGWSGRKEEAARKREKRRGCQRVFLAVRRSSAMQQWVGRPELTREWIDKGECGVKVIRRESE